MVTKTVGNHMRQHDFTNDIDMTDAGDASSDGVSNGHGIARTTPGASNDDHEHNPAGAVDERRFVVAVDFGTTFSTVAYACLDANADATSVRAQDVKCIDGYPDLPGGSASTSAMSAYENVPTEIWYREDIPPGFDGDWVTPELPLGAHALDSSDEESPTSDTSEVSDHTRRLAQAHTLQKRANRRTSPCDVVWGYGVHKGIEHVDRLGDPRRRLTRFKLMLDSTSSHTRGIREAVSENTRFLKAQGLISGADQIISDYLEKLLEHAKVKLMDTEGLKPTSPIEFVITVPTVWSAAACMVMHDAMANAIKGSGLGKLEKGSIDNLYLVSEPEAAAEFVVDDPEHKINVRPGETILILDAGGGTVDAAMYLVTGTLPLRLERQAVDVDGALCGSSFLNEEYREALRRRLSGFETDVSPKGVPFENELNSMVIAWEHGDKRTIDVTDRSTVEYSDFIRGLEYNPSKGFDGNRLYWKRDEMIEIFWPCLKGVQDLLKTQLELAATKKIDVSKVILVGGFAASSSLHNYLQKFLGKERSFTGAKIELKRPKSYATSAVGRGAVPRALRKTSGPKRISRSSFGFLRTEEFDPDTVDAHKGVKPKYDRVDGGRWVDNTIYWVIQKGEEELPSVYELPRLHVCHTFSLKKKYLLCEEVLYASEYNHSSHYRVSHAENKDKAMKMASIVADMTFLRGSPDIIETEIDAKTGREKRYYKIDMDLVMIVEDRNLRFEAHWPRGSNQVIQSGQVSLAFAFEPGTV